MAIRGGTLRKRVQIQQRATTQDSTGQQSTVWTTIATVWADIESMTARELVAAQSVNMEATHTITVRYQAIFAQPKIVATYRALYNSRVFNISGMDNVEERNALVVLTAAEGLNDG